MADLAVGPDTRVTLHFALTLEDGSEVDSTFARKPASFDFGDGQLLSGIEQKLLGLKAGDRRQLSIAPEDAFGQPNPANVQRFSRDQFSADLQLEVGLMISFADAQRAELPGVVSNISGDSVSVDFNHPLAGRTLGFSVEILDVTPATAGQ